MIHFYDATSKSKIATHRFTRNDSCKITCSALLQRHWTSYSCLTAIHWTLKLISKRNQLFHSHHHHASGKKSRFNHVSLIWLPLAWRKKGSVMRMSKLEMAIQKGFELAVVPSFKIFFLVDEPQMFSYVSKLKGWTNKAKIKDPVAKTISY